MEVKPKKKRGNRKKIRITGFFLLAVLAAGSFAALLKYREEICMLNEAGSDYNILAKAYVDISQQTELKNIADIPDAEQLNYRPLYEEGISGMLSFVTKGQLPFGIQKQTEQIRNETDLLAEAYLIAEQITNPAEDWVTDRLKQVEGINGCQAVTRDRDPNMYLGKEGGYTACIYFSAAEIDPETVDGSDLIAKGTDAGGAVEVYQTVEDARNRCEYLAGFDQTLMYSGSYLILGTMVIRTSYQLSDQEQIEYTDRITRKMTEL